MTSSVKTMSTSSDKTPPHIKNPKEYNYTMNADDLDDGLDYDFNSGVVSADEGETIALSDNENSYKRKLSHGDDEPNKKTISEDSANQAPLSKRQKKLQNSKFHNKKKEKMEFEKSQRLALSTLSGEDIAENLNKMIGLWYPDLSPLELEELYFKKTEFIPTTSYTEPRTAENFQDFVTKFTKAPKAIVFCSTNIRVADVFRNLGGSKQCLKLFSKNKLKEDLERLEELSQEKKKPHHNEIKYFISTPNRMEKIVKESPVFFQGKDKLDIIIDSSYLDPKTDTIFTSLDGKVLCSVLKKIIKEKSSVKILLY
ncbi:Protein CMS1 [Hanseniaspora osmophila]|uniref:Protein CMS1 n=1 Tax=Hanseniaspora osmophila TaxID=56408 RepID=A0A1E5R1X4_9ASCO|nr:Protein CMS1 [Hanseniaspora osmophila]